MNKGHTGYGIALNFSRNNNGPFRIDLHFHFHDQTFLRKEAVQQSKIFFYGP
jgi:hypothetical protein